MNFTGLKQYYNIKTIFTWNLHDLKKKLALEKIRKK